ncbi:MAG TPA: hypothetical protein VFA65_20395 [Bryobacteraceae bacterium]|nr:hypothetical protein [Bryobacteraceae bacterium]
MRFLYKANPISLAAVLICSNFTLSAIASDLESLVRLLVPAFLAQNLTLVCATERPEFLAELSEKSSLVNSFADHVKAEVTMGMSENEAKEIRIVAANTARDEVLRNLNAAKPEKADTRLEELNNWCRSRAKPLILEIISVHQTKHAEFERKVVEAKR